MASRTSSKSVLSALVRLLHTHTLSNSVVMENDNFFQVTYVTGYGKTDHFAHNFKIELLVFKGSVDLKQ